ncbi:hypothetical protein IVB57_14175 [Bradyrhizobium sp. CW9]|uniref:hypothetical protein n=1 Tax=Bradyrhizobium sp. CW9 TaxID=2782689 RepID=UPI001FFB2062|nr:hypothetical protein [Bradyrhizobium sp. CW9]MCK1329487.1 hypothetical protein [Bradyrhizobium sp. CW9]
MKKANIVINTVAGAAVLLTVAGWGVMSGRAQGTPEAIADAQGALHVPQNRRWPTVRLFRNSYECCALRLQ